MAKQAIPRFEGLVHKAIEEAEYKAKLKEYQLKLLRLQLDLKDSRSSVILVVEGPDAAGKGGSIKRVVERLDPRTVRVYSTVKPTAEEYAHHYLWRFWKRLPAYGEFAVFDRSWYGRVLVERVEKFASEEEWGRAYGEINAFEKMLYDDGAIIVKIYIHIDKDEQLARFKAREADPLKHWKITEEDWRNRKKSDQHNAAAQDMFEKTSTEIAPWTLIGGNFKWYARVKAVKTVVEAVQARLGK